MENVSVNYNSGEAAEYKTGISGWVSRDGRFWGDNEHMARWSGCTHTECEDCLKPTPKSYLRCAECRDKRNEDRYRNLPSRSWDHSSPVYSDSVGEWFNCLEEVEEYCEEHECTKDSLLLLLGEPEYLPQVDEEHFYDSLPEDCYDIPNDVQEALDALNKVVRSQPPSCYFPSKTAVCPDSLK